MEQPSDPESMILIMGVTGAGKSYMINTLAGKAVADESSTLHSCTAICQMIPVNIGKSRVFLIDTPGFDDSKRSDTEILTEISKLLTCQYKLGIQLKGVIYLHRVTDQKYSGSSIKTLNIFRKICGDDSLGHVILVTTRWTEVEESIGAARETELREDFWKDMIRHGSRMTRFYGDKDSAVSIVSQLIGNHPVVLNIQRELVDEQRTLDQTSAGALLTTTLEEVRAKHASEMAELEEASRKAALNRSESLEDLNSRWRQQQAWMRQAESDQVRLRADIEREVREEMDHQIARSKKTSKLQGFTKQLLPFLPTAISILGMFVGIPTGATGILSSWLASDGFSNTLSEIFSNF